MLILSFYWRQIHLSHLLFLYNKLDLSSLRAAVEVAEIDFSLTYVGVTTKNLATFVAEKVKRRSDLCLFVPSFFTTAPNAMCG